jgi:Tol biopolymer transport system component
VYELGATAVPRRLTFAGNARFPVWSGNGQFVAFQSDHEGDNAIFRKRADGTGVVERLTKPETGTAHVPETWSPEGAHLLYRVVKNNTHTLWDLTIGGTSTPYGDVQSGGVTSAVFSPDGRWVAYGFVDASGQRDDPSGNSGIWVQPYPATGARYPAPKGFRDFFPAWSADGATLFYVATLARPVVRMAVQTRGTVAFGPPTAFEGAPSSRLGVNLGRSYDVLPDGGFVSVADDPAAGPQELRVILNWHEELKRLAPAK